MAQFEENSILREFLDVFQNGTPARLALFGVAQSEALLYIVFKPRFSIVVIEFLEVVKNVSNTVVLIGNAL